MSNATVYQGKNHCNIRTEVTYKVFLYTDMLQSINPISHTLTPKTKWRVVKGGMYPDGFRIEYCNSYFFGLFLEWHLYGCCNQEAGAIQMIKDAKERMLAELEPESIVYQE